MIQVVQRKTSPSKLCCKNTNLSLAILTDLIFKVCSLGLELNTWQLVEVWVMLINFSSLPYEILLVLP